MDTIFEILLHAWVVGPLCLLIGVTLGFVLYKTYGALLKKGAEFEAEEMLQEVRDAIEIRNLEEKERTQEIETEIWAKEEPHLLKLEENIEELTELAEEKKQKSDNKYSQARQRTVEKENELKSEESKIQKMDDQLKSLRQKVKDLNQNLVDRLSQNLGQGKDQIKQEIIEQILRETQTRSLETAQYIEDSMKEHAESRAKEILDTVINRFHRAACPERGIAPVYYADEQFKKDFLSLPDTVYKAVQDNCGCDIIVDEQMDMVGVAGFDPVRRELTRRVLERILKENRPGPRNPVTVDWVNKVAGNIKTEILRTIKNDGDSLAKELKLENLHPEIRQMMGSLRYRYSFTQNQYFHCGEVGWLCGLLASEIKTVETKKARRSGMLHDLGKAMDHEKDGGHAVIGADFINERGEAADIMHAVRAHHFDEQPSTDMAYLVIAADAISGARPGARRSTIESYNQKVSALQDIAFSFEGVTDCFILSGGRECRVLVNGRKIDDHKALKMSHDIAKRIETECSYPGQIKVVVVRETVVVESTKVAHG